MTPKLPGQKATETLLHEAARMLVHRSGWYSTKLHLALIMMALVTLVFWRMGFPPEQFANYCVAMNVSAGIYSGSRVGESFAQRGRPPFPPEVFNDARPSP